MVSTAPSAPVGDDDYRPPLLKRLSTFWPTDQELLKRGQSLEFLSPAHDCETRKSSPTIAIANLFATVCGGGVLTLPIAFSRAGVIPATLLMIFAAAITDFAMYILCSCARRTGGRTYGDVVLRAFGPMAEIWVNLVLVFLLFFVVIAYMVLVKDICTPMVLYLWPRVENLFAKASKSVDDDVTETIASKYILVLVLVCSLPLLLKKDLHALRHTCYVGLASVLVLFVGVVDRAIQRNIYGETGFFKSNVVWVGSWEGVMFAFPIIVLSFFSIYNVPGVHSALKDPTRKRVKLVIDGTIIVCFSVFYVVGLCGYLCAYDATSDNILLNFPLTYKLIFCGRFGYLLTLMFGLPLVFLPCREVALHLPEQISEYRRNLRGEYAELDVVPRRMEQGMQVPSVGERKPLLFKLANQDRFDSHDTFMKRSTAGTAVVIEEGVEGNTADGNGKSEYDGRIKHYVSTFAIIALCFYFAVSVPGVGVVWSIVGSSMAIVTGFVIPCACYLKIRSRKGINPRSFGSWLLLIFSIGAAIVCSNETMKQIKAGA